MYILYNKGSSFYANLPQWPGRGVDQNHTPYCKVYTQRKYTLFGGKTTVKKKDLNKETTLEHRRGGQPGVVEDHTFTFFYPSLNVLDKC